MWWARYRLQRIGNDNAINTEDEDEDGKHNVHDDKSYYWNIWKKLVKSRQQQQRIDLAGNSKYQSEDEDKDDNIMFMMTKVTIEMFEIFALLDE